MLMFAIIMMMDLMLMFALMMMDLAVRAIASALVLVFYDEAKKVGDF